MKIFIMVLAFAFFSNIVVQRDGSLYGIENPDGTTLFPETIYVDYVRVCQNASKLISIF